MDVLPPSLIIEILNRLDDFTDIARCRVASKTLNNLSYELRSLNLICSFDRYLKSKATETKTQITPFKSIVKKTIMNSRNVEFISVGVEKPFRGFSDDDGDDESDNLHLTAVNFVSEWLPETAGRLKSLSISDFWIQSCWRRSEALSLISWCCQHLLKLEVKNAWLSVEGLKPMPMLTSLTLEFIRLDDEDLNKVNNCFPSLKVINLIGVGGIKEPRIHLLHLKSCQWTVSDAPLSLIIQAPKLIELELKCVKPRTLVLETPLLSTLHLTIEKTSDFRVKRFLNLKSLQIVSSDLCSLICLFPDGETVEKLLVDSRLEKKIIVTSPKWVDPVEVRGEISFEALLSAFPNASILTLGPGAWLEMELRFCIGGLESRSGMDGLKKIMAHLVVSKFEVTHSFISYMLDLCTNLSDMTLLVHRDTASNVARQLISRCMNDCPRVRWRWGMWKEGTEDTWVSDCV